MFDLKEKIDPEKMHHAYLLLGERESVRENLFSFLEDSLSIQTQGNPDFWHGVFDSLLIEDARLLRTMQLRHPTVGQKKFFVITTNTITHEAQNALLKVFEEPTAGTHFFIITSRREHFLPTVLSRLVEVNLQEMYSDDPPSSATHFLSLSLKDRLSEVKKLTDAVSLEKITKADIISFLDSLEKEIHKRSAKLKSDKKHDLQVLEDILYAKRALSGRSPSVKLLLESLLLTL